MGRGKEDCMKKMDKADNIFSKVFRWREILTGASFVIILVAAAYAIFVLPYRYPPKEAADSASYAMGFNNTVSVIACIAAIALLSLRFGGLA